MTIPPRSTQPEATDPGEAWAWDLYWRDGRLASCGGAGGVSYRAAISDSWRRFFRGLRAGSHILDVCTGNGAVARLAAETASARGIRFSIEAFDSAAIAPHLADGKTAAGEDMIRFRPRIPAESTPYPTDTFDAITGQYAIEYTAMARSLPELARVSKDDCRVRFVVHASEGVVVAAARQQLSDVERLRRAGDIFGAATQLAQLRAHTAAPEAVQAAMEHYHRLAQDVRAAARDAIEPAMYTNVTKVLTHALSQQVRAGTPAVLDKITEVARMVEAHATRLSAMTHAAMDERQVQDFAHRTSRLWEEPMQVATEKREDGALLGWVVETAQRPAHQVSDPDA